MGREIRDNACRVFSGLLTGVVWETEEGAKIGHGSEYLKVALSEMHG